MTESTEQNINRELVNIHEVTSWLHSKEPAFMAELQIFADKKGMGYQEVISTKGYEDYYKENKIFKFWKRPLEPTPGKFTGAGLCAMAVGAMERAMIEKYGDEIETSSVFIVTEHKDMDEGYKDPKYEMGHHILRFRIKGADIWYTADPTYRQFQEKVKIGRIVITPSTNESRLYSYEKTYQKMLAAGSPEAWKYKPQTYPRGKLFERYQMQIRDKEHKGVVENDYQNLVDALLS